MITDNIPDISFIDNTTVDEIMNGMISDYQEKYKELTHKEISLAPADPYRLIMYACTMQIYQAMQYADYAGKMSFLTYARGDYLDNLAALRGVQRIESAAAATVLRFSIESPLKTVIPIPTGCRVTNGNNVFFATDEYTEIPAGETSIMVSATCTAEGAVGNGFAPGELSVLVNTVPYITSVINMVTTYGGADKEDDESLRERIYAYPNAYSTAGPAGAYEYYAKTAFPEISDVIVRSEAPGEVDIYFICDGGVIPEDTLIQKVKERLDDRNIRPLTDKVTVLAPEAHVYNIDMTYYISASNKAEVSAIQTKVDMAVSVYNTWQTDKIGRDINPSYLIQKVMEAGAKRVEVYSPDFTVINESTVAQIGTVTVNFGGVEND